MKSFVSRWLVLVPVLLPTLLLGACSNEAAPTSAPGSVTVEGPNTDGEFYVIGEAHAATPGESVLFTNASGDRVSVIANADGSFAGHLWSAIDKEVTVDAAGVQSAKAPAHPVLVNVNVASLKGLESVPGIGPSLAQRIADYRAHVHLFAEPADLADVDGIGAVSVQKMLPWVETKIDVNTAPLTWLEALPQIGAARAHAIVAYRSAHGAFHSVDELGAVPGLSASIVDAIRPYVKAGNVENPGTSVVDINDADIDTLVTLPGIGTVKAIAIIDWRNEHGPFLRCEDLIDVPGIGPATVAGLDGLIMVGLTDMKTGTFAVEGGWTYDDGAGGHAHGSFAPESVLVSLDHKQDASMDVTLIGAGFENPDPFTVSARSTSEAPNGDFTYALSGAVPGGLTIVSASSEGTVTSTTISVALTATDGARTYHATLTGYRILD